MGFGIYNSYSGKILIINFLFASFKSELGQKKKSVRSSFLNQTRRIIIRRRRTKGWFWNMLILVVVLTTPFMLYLLYAPNIN